VDGKKISASARRRLREGEGLGKGVIAVTSAESQNTTFLTYGEICHSSFVQLLNSISGFRSGVNEIFVDLGCGVGKALFTAVLEPSGSFNKVVGIELIPELIDEALSVKQVFVESLSIATREKESMNGGGLGGGGGGGARDNIQKNKTTKKTSIADTGKISTLDSLVVESIKDVLGTSPDHRLPLEALANNLTKVLGHRVYKRAMKGRGSFSRFLDYLATLYPRLQISDIPNEGKCVLYDDACEMNSEINLETCEEAEELEESSSATTTIADSNNESSAKTIEIAVLLQQSDSRVFLPLPEIILCKGDIFDRTVFDWALEGDVIYCASLLFSDEMMMRLTNFVERMKSGGIFITLKPLYNLISPPKTSRVHLKSTSFYKMSWEVNFKSAQSVVSI